MHTNVMRLQPALQFCRDDDSSSTFYNPNIHGGQRSECAPVVEVPKEWRGIPGAPHIQGVWHVELSLTPFEPYTAEYVNGARFDLRAANLRLDACAAARG